MTETVSALSGQATTPPPSMPSANPELQNLSHRFNEMMAREPDPSIYTEQHLQSTGSPVSAFVRSQEHMMSQTFEKMQALGRDAPNLDMHQLLARQMELQQQMVMVSLQFSSSTYIAQSGKSGLQTLMKNQ